MDDLDSKNNGSENNSGSYCQAEDKIEPDAWLYQKLTGEVKLSNQKMFGYSGQEPLFSQSTITKAIEKVFYEYQSSFRVESQKRLSSLMKELNEVFSRE